jgi:hypothetical protein
VSGSRDHGARLVRTTQTIRREIDGWTITNTCTPPSEGSRRAADRAVVALHRLNAEALSALQVIEEEISDADGAAAGRGRLVAEQGEQIGIEELAGDVRTS